MARRRVLELFILTLALTTIYFVLGGCEGIEQPEPDKNKEPETELTGVPLDSSNTFYRVHLFWKGFDSDGLIQGFEYAVDDTSRNEFWVFTTRSDSEFVFNTATEESQQQRRSHLFFVRAIDNEGKEDPSPSEIQFFAQTSAQPLSFLLTDTVNRMAVNESVIYVAGGTNGLDIFDISDPGDIRRVATLFTGGTATDVVYTDGMVFLADGEGGIVVLDVSDPADPVVIARYPTLGRAASALDWSEPYLFVADGSNGILVLDMSVPSDPVFLGRYSPNSPHEFIGLAVHGDLVFGAAGERGVVALEFRPDSDEFILVPLPEGSPRTFITEHTAYSFWPEDGILYVADGEGGILVLQVDADGSLQELNRFCLDGKAVQVLKRDPYLYIANGYSGICIVDVSDPMSPVQTDRVGFSGDVTGLAFRGDTLVVGIGDRGLALLDVTDPGEADLLEITSVEFCPESPAETETLLAFSSVKFCWDGVSPGGQVVAYRYQLQGVDQVSIEVSPDSITAFYQNLVPKDEYVFTVETKDETGLWSSGDGTAERRFTVNFNPESFLDSIWVTGPYTDAGPIPLAAADTLLPDSTFIHFRWHHTDRDTVQGDTIVGSWWRVGGGGFVSPDSLDSVLIGQDVAGPLLSSPPTGYILEVGGIDKFERREENGATYRFQINYPPDVQVLSPEVFETVLTSDSVTVTLQGMDADGPPRNLLYEYRFRTAENSFLGSGELSGLFGTNDGVIEVTLPTFGITALVVFEVTPIDRGGRGKTGAKRVVQFFVRG